MRKYFCHAKAYVTNCPYVCNVPMPIVYWYRFVQNKYQHTFIQMLALQEHMINVGVLKVV